MEGTQNVNTFTSPVESKETHRRMLSSIPSLLLSNKLSTTYQMSSSPPASSHINLHIRERSGRHRSIVFRKLVVVKLGHTQRKESKYKPSIGTDEEENE
jgi:hypothetical protein